MRKGRKKEKWKQKGNEVRGVIHEEGMMTKEGEKGEEIGGNKWGKKNKRRRERRGKDSGK